jgi:predicted RNase H-like HicB family nuclease
VKLGRRYTGALSSAIVLTQGGVTMKEQLTAVFQKVPEGYIAFVEELPGANSQGDTLEEARSNLREAVQLVLEANRSIAKEALGDTSVIREPLAQIS